MRYLRMLVGYLLACFGAAMALALFAFSPNSVEGFFDKLPDIIESAWNVSPHLTGALFVLGAVPALIAFQYAEHHHIRSWVYYELIGAAVAIAAYWLAHGTDTVPLKSEGNIYSTIAFGVAGAVLGLLYWLFAGRYAGQDQQQPAIGRTSERMRSPKTDTGRFPHAGVTREAARGSTWCRFSVCPMFESAEWRSERTVCSEAR